MSALPPKAAFAAAVGMSAKWMLCGEGGAGVTGTPVCLRAWSFSIRPMSALGQKRTLARLQLAASVEMFALRRPRLSTVQEPQIERPEHQDYSDVYHQPLPEPVPEEQDIHAEHDGYQREHVKYDGCLSCHPSFLVRATERSQSGAWIADDVF